VSTTPQRREVLADVRERLELAVLERLLSLRLDRGGPVALIKPYSGDLERLFDDETTDSIKRAVGGQIPALLIAAGAVRYTSTSAAKRRSLGVLELEILAVSSTVRAMESRERGRDGLFAIMRDVRALLHGEELGVRHCAPLQPLTEEPMLHTVGLSVWKQTFTAQIEEYNDRQPSGHPITDFMASGYVGAISGAGEALTAAAGLVTLRAPAGGFHRGLVGLGMYLTGAATAGNNGGPFPITDVPEAGEGREIVFQNPAGVTEAFSGTWTVKRTTPLVQGLVTS
jgi:hypothetical protein